MNGICVRKRNNKNTIGCSEVEGLELKLALNGTTTGAHCTLSWHQHATITTIPEMTADSWTDTGAQ